MAVRLRPGMEAVLTAAAHRDPLLVCIVGATATGKSALAMHLAERFNGEIVNCDSVAVYRDLEIGTAKPSRAERALVPHHLLDIAAPDEQVTAGDYARLARKAIGDISARGHLPIVAGGTGLYLRALLDGLFPGPPRSEELRDRLRAAAERRPDGHLHRILHRLDARAAARVHPNDEAKLIRAIEVAISTGASISELWQRGRDPLTGYRVLKLSPQPSRPALYERINQRCAEMFDRGLVDEARMLLERYGDVRPLESLGYRQAIQHLRGELTRDEMIAATQQGHRNYAKRQDTWFRREAEMHWLAGFGSSPAVISAAEDLVRDRI